MMMQNIPRLIFWELTKQCNLKCKHCRATIAQMESEIAAVDTIKANVIRELQELASPEKKIVHVHVSEVLGNVVETPEDVEQAVERLKEHLLKLLAEDTRIVLE